VWVYSEPEMGTEFKIYLPRVRSVREQSPASEIAAGDGGGTETILLVEDEESLREVIGTYLSGKGYRVLSAENGNAALRLCETWSGGIDVLLSDFIMPGMRGPEVAAEVLRMHPGTRVILMSGYADRELGQHDFLQKPVNLRVLAEHIRLVLDRQGETLRTG